MDTHALHQSHLDGASLRKLSQETGLAVATLRRRFQKEGLPIRSRKEATRIANVSRTGEKRSERTAYDYVRELRQRKAVLIREFKNSRGCQRCGECHPATLDIHHLKPEEKHPRLKRKNAAGSRRTGGYFWRDLSFADLKAELAKCEVICSNCHRKEHYVGAVSSG